MSTPPRPSLPPPTAPAPRPVARRSWWQRQGSTRQSLIIATLVLAVGVIVVVFQQTTKRDDSPTMTPAEAACSMLRDGDSPQQAFDAMKLLLRDQSYAVGDDTDAAARRAVDGAVAQGCG